MKVHVVNLVEKGLKEVNKKIYEAKVAVMGLAYKKNIDDARESPSIKIIEELVNLGAEVRVYDPYVKSIKTKVGEFYSEKSMEYALRDADCAVFVVDHDVFKEKEMEMRRMRGLMKSPVVVDCKNAFGKGSGVVYLGIGKGD
jgi:UDP-N-acetyl-D-glucosamine dehydrogenase